jgi:hypothetical protein
MKPHFFLAATLHFVTAAELIAQWPLKPNNPVKVPGEKPAYHCSPNPNKDDLFWIQDLTMMPKPIET